MTPFFITLFNVHIMNANCAKFQKKFDSRTISRELPYVANHFVLYDILNSFCFRDTKLNLVSTSFFFFFLLSLFVYPLLILAMSINHS